ncbi:hypothetical protein [Croceibacterium mercuriale]|nr:hypothetical protein [Croceibacterium mercuriale]
MAILDWFTGLFSGSSNIGAGPEIEPTRINPATGLPMTGGVDVGGNPYGIDLHRWQDDYTHQQQSIWQSPADWDHWSNQTTSSSSYDPSRGW